MALFSLFSLMIFFRLLNGRTLVRCESVCFRADFRWTSDGSAGCTFHTDSIRPAADSTRVHRGPKNPQQICRGSTTSAYAAERWNFWPRKKPKKSASPPNESESVRHGLFFRFWRTILSATDPLRIRCGFLVRSKNPPKKFFQLWSA